MGLSLKCSPAKVWLLIDMREILYVTVSSTSEKQTLPYMRFTQGKYTELFPFSGKIILIFPLYVMISV